MLSKTQCFDSYRAMFLHFKEDKYDGFKYKFKAGRAAGDLNRRHDKYQFDRLANNFTRRDLLLEYLVANMIEDKFYPSDMDQKTYLEWQGRINSLYYNFRLDMKSLMCYISDIGFDATFISDDGQYPVILQKYMAGDIALESLVIFIKLIGIDTLPHYDDFVWPDLRRKIVKYSPFIQFDRNKYSAALEDILKDSKEAS